MNKINRSQVEINGTNGTKIKSLIECFGETKLLKIKSIFYSIYYMDIKEYFYKMKNIEEKLLDFLDKVDDEEENYGNFVKIINDENIGRNPYDFKIVLYLISKISNNHHQMPKFYDKIEQILKRFKEEITQFFSNEEIFKIFKSNKRILLFLTEEQILTIDHNIYKEMNTYKYRVSSIDLVSFYMIN